MRRSFRWYSVTETLLDEYTAARFDTMCERYSIPRESPGASPDA